MSSDLIFKVSADLAEVKAALNELRGQFQKVGNVGAASPLNRQLDETIAKTRQAASEADKAAIVQERATRKAAEAREREASKAQAAERRAQAERDRAARKAEQDLERQARRQAEIQRRAQESAQRQATAQQRALAPQLTDIGVGLATGQSPLMVLLQQGGQLKDLFGGIVPAARAVGGAVAGLITPFTALAAAIGVVAIGYVKGADEAARFRRIVIETGGVAGQTAAQLDAQAASIARLSGGSRAAAAETLSQVVEVGKFAGEQIGIVALAAERLRVTAGKDVAATVAEFAALGDDPVKASAELNRRIGFLNGSLVEQIRTLRDQGRTQEAATLAMRAYADTVADRTPKIKENLGIIEKAWAAIKRGSAAASDAILNIGRDPTAQQTFDDLIKRRQELENRLASGDRGGRRRAATERELADVKARIQAVSDAETAAQQDANRRAAQARAVAEQQRLVEEAQQFESSTERLNREKTQVINRAANALADAQTAADDVAQREIARARDARLAAIGREQARTPLAVAQSNATLVKDDVDRLIGELQRLYDRGLISAETYFTKRRDLLLKSTDAEIAAQRAELATTQEPADIARIGAQIRVLERKKADIRRDAIREQATATRQLEEQLLDNEVGLNRDALDRNLQVLQRFYEAAGLSTEDYFKARREVQEQAIDESKRLLQKRLQSEDLSPADRARLLGEVERLERDRSDVQLAAIRDGAQAAKDLRLQLDQARAQELEAKGQTAEAAKIRIEAQFADLLKRLEADGNEAGKRLVRGLIDTGVAKAQFDEIKAQFDRVLSELRAKQQQIASQRDTGQISGDVAIQQQRQAQEQAVNDLRALNAEIQKLAADPNALPAVKQGALEAAQALDSLAVSSMTGLDAAIVNLRASLANLQEGFAQAAVGAGVDALTGLFTDLASGTKTAGEAVRDFARSFLLSMAQIAARALATFLVLQAFEAIFPGFGRLVAATGSIGANVKHGGGMAGQGTRRNVSPLAFAGAPRYHEGSGVLGLKPGEIPAILQTGERVQSRQEVAAQQRTQGGGGTRIVNVIDPGLVTDALASASGEKVVLNIIERNAAGIRQRLA